MYERGADSIVFRLADLYWTKRVDLSCVWGSHGSWSLVWSTPEPIGVCSRKQHVSIHNTCGIIFDFGKTRNQTQDNYWLIQMNHKNISHHPSGSCGPSEAVPGLEPQLAVCLAYLRDRIGTWSRTCIDVFFSVPKTCQLIYVNHSCPVVFPINQEIFVKSISRYY